MAGPGRIPGRYNLVLKGSYDTFDYQVPVEEYVELLREEDVPEEISVVGLHRVFEDEESIDEFRRVIDQHANDLENRHPLPTIQFAVEGSFHRSGKTYDLRYQDDLYALREVFGPQIERKGKGDWLVAPF